MRRKTLAWFFIGFAAGAIALAAVVWFTTGAPPFDPAVARAPEERPVPEPPGPAPDPYPLTRPAPAEPPPEAEADRAAPDP
jgi:hypothetical protein